MAKPGRGARIKGASFERALAKLLSDATGLKFNRGLGQARKGGKEIADVYSDELPQYHFEAKRQIKCNIKAAMVQALGDVENTNKIPIVVTKDDHGEILVTMQYKDWIAFFIKAIE
jgi:hypothetical protein